MKNRKTRGEAFTLFIAGMALAMTAIAASMKAHDPNDQLDWLPPYQQSPAEGTQEVMDEEDFIYQEMDKVKARELSQEKNNEN